MENARIEQISRRIFAFLIVQLTFESYSSDWEKGGTFDEKGLGHSALGKDWLCGNEFYTVAVLISHSCRFELIISS